MTHLRATVAAERRLSCGCAVVRCAPKFLDDHTGRFLTSEEVVVVPCAKEGHLVLARLAAQNVGADDVDVLAVEIERLLSSEGIVPDIDLAHDMARQRNR